MRIASIFRPQFNITDLIRQRLEALDQVNWLIEHMLLMPKHEVWLRRDVTVSRVAATTRIEGANLDEQAVGRLLQDSRRPRDQDERDNVNALRAYEFVDYLSDEKDVPLDELVVRQLNREFMYGSADTLTPGIYRKGQNSVGNFIPPNQGDVPGLMRDFALWLKCTQELDAALKAGIAHIHLVAIHPFWDGNGRTARALSTLILQRSPYHFRRLLSLESDLLHGRDRYFSMLGQTLGTTFSECCDMTRWLEFFAVQVLESAQALVGNLTEWHRVANGIRDAAEDRGLKPRQADGLFYAFRTGRITRAEYIEVASVMPITASRDLGQLSHMGLLKPVGQGRNRHYLPVKVSPSVSAPQDTAARRLI